MKTISQDRAFDNAGAGYRERFLGEMQASELLGLSVRTLQRWRGTGEGPAFVKLGRSVRYRESMLLAWAAAQERQSTSDDVRFRSMAA